MLHQQFENDLRHLERIIPLLPWGNPLPLSYWRDRLTTLSLDQRLVPDGAVRVARLLYLFDGIEQALVMQPPLPSIVLAQTPVRSRYAALKSDNDRSDSRLTTP